jgi:hypothetical protein
MAGSRSAGVGRFLNRLLMLGLVCLSGYLYWQNQKLQNRNSHLSGQIVDQNGGQYPWSHYKLNLPPSVTSFGGHDLALVNQAKAHILNAEKAAQAGNFGLATQESKAADDELQQAEQGASSQSRTAVGGLRSTVSDFQRRVHAAAKAFGS